MKNCFDVAVDMVLVFKADTSFDDWPISSHLPRRAGRKGVLSGLRYMSGLCARSAAEAIVCANLKVAVAATCRSADINLSTEMVRALRHCHSPKLRDKHSTLSTAAAMEPALILSQRSNPEATADLSAKICRRRKPQRAVHTNRQAGARMPLPPLWTIMSSPRSASRDHVEFAKNLRRASLTEGSRSRTTSSWRAATPTLTYLAPIAEACAERA